MSTAADPLEPHWPASARAAVRAEVIEKATAEADQVAAATTSDADSLLAFVIDQQVARHDAAVARIADIVALPEAAGRERLGFVIGHRTSLSVVEARALLAGVEKGVCAVMPFGSARKARLAAMRRAAAGSEG